MFAICLEASHVFGMGHLFRMLNFVRYLECIDRDFVFLINDNKKTKKILEEKKYKYEVVELNDFLSDWETTLIKKYDFVYWINDRLNTRKEHLLHILKNGIKTITFDDLGDGSEYCDINVCGLFFNRKNLNGKKILCGVKYLILNPEIDLYKRKRKNLNNIIVTLGGSDTYGVTVKILQILKKNNLYNINVTIHTGPSFEHKEELYKELVANFKVIDFTPSLIKEFRKYDLAITGGGITPFEANASGLPCLVVANEDFEIPNGEYLHSIGSSVFLGFHESIDFIDFKNIKNLNLEQMSQIGLVNLDTKAANRIYQEIMLL